MPYTEADLPFAAGSHESYAAAEHAAATRATKTAKYLRFLAKHGPRTDHETASYFGWPLSSVTSIRNGTMRCGLVEAGAETKQSPYGLRCRTWQLTAAGRGAAL